MGYVAAIADVFVGTGTCVPEHTTNGQLAEMVAQALQNDPAHRNIVASFIVMGAMNKAWPEECGPGIKGFFNLIANDWKVAK